MGRCNVNWFDVVVMVFVCLGKTNEDCRCKRGTSKAFEKSGAIRIYFEVQSSLCKRDQTSEQQQQTLYLSYLLNDSGVLVSTVFDELTMT